MITNISELWKAEATKQDKFVRDLVFIDLEIAYAGFVKEILEHYPVNAKTNGAAWMGFRRGVIAYLHRTDLPKDMKFSNFVSYFVKCEIEAQVSPTDRQGDYDAFNTEGIGLESTRQGDYDAFNTEGIGLEPTSPDVSPEPSWNE